MKMRLSIALLLVALSVTDVRGIRSQLAPDVAWAAGPPYLNEQYWPNWAYSPLTTVPVFKCRLPAAYQPPVAAGVVTWQQNGAGLVQLANAGSFCNVDGAVNVMTLGGTWCEGCEGSTQNIGIFRTLRNPETGAVGRFLEITRSEIYLKAGLPQPGPTTMAHELGHVVGLKDQYIDDGDGTLHCSNSGVPSLMDLCQVATPQAQDIAWVNWLYRSAPGAPDSFSIAAPAFNAINLNWADRAYNERTFRIERSVGGGAWTYAATVARDGTNWNELTQANTRTCYRLQTQNDWGVSSDWVYPSCVTTPHAVGSIGGSFNNYAASICAGRISGSGASSYTFVALGWITAQTIVSNIADNTSCYGSVLWQRTLVQDYWHFAVKGCNGFGCSGYRDMTSPNQAWTIIPGGGSGGGSGNTAYHSH